MVVRLDVYGSEELENLRILELEKLLCFARVAFSNKRKQLCSTLGTLPEVSPAAVKAALRSLGRSETARPQELSTDDWVALYRAFHQQ